MKLWNGRFNKNASQLLDAFNNSLSFDYILYPYDIQGSIAHVKMLASVGIITHEEKKMIIEGLNKILQSIQEGTFEFNTQDEDIHMAIEKALIDEIGTLGKKLHTARSRNDQIALDMRLYTKDQIEKIMDQLKALLQALNALSLQHIKVYLPGYTHLQGAQVISLGFYFQAYFSKFKRDLLRFKQVYKSADVMPLGAGALAGVNYKTNREMIKDLLGFSKVTENALDTVSDRDYIVELLNACSLLFTHLSRFCEEMIIYASQEYAFISLDDAYSTGSSIMPQKKNPDVAELIRGKSGKITANLMGLLMVMKGLPLAYNKDMQEDKKYLFSSCEETILTLEIFTEMIKTTKINEQRMREACNKGFLQATDLADYLVEKGLEFREAHHVIGTMVGTLEKENKTFHDLTLEEFKTYHENFDIDVFKYLEIEHSVNLKKSKGSTSFESVTEMIQNNQQFLDNIVLED